jgi:hypothetical protein
MAQSPSFFLLLFIIFFIYKLLMSFVTTVIKECRRHCDGNGLRKSEICNANVSEESHEGYLLIQAVGLIT